MIAHRMRTVENASHLVVLENGRVAEEGTSGQLLENNGLYKHMVDLQSMSYAWKIQRIALVEFCTALQIFGKILIRIIMRVYKIPQ